MRFGEGTLVLHGMAFTAVGGRFVSLVVSFFFFLVGWGEFGLFETWIHLRL